ncbi:carboxy terminal-processing peptidase [Fluviispira sanaruensis]|uniref:Tail-specific protease n=1 Tax=Fluviispira sanaruensis TaxID=2493639 RepID=A0A4P2VTC0_FLUSA|nr:carboxy terminal-processing peptidase [Fluviispira sanaruensis]BBH52615.1 tail-specific protease [Fluviispira sanaruensis]
MRIVANMFLAFLLCCLAWESIAPKIAYGDNSKNARIIASVLSCREVKLRVNAMLDLHFFYTEFNEDLSKKTFKKIFDLMDPSKVYFIKSDIKSFSYLENSLNKKIENNNCDFLFEIFSLFLKRVGERIEKTKFFLAKPIDFSKPDYIPSGKIDWSSNFTEADERMKKRVKIQYISSENLEEDSAKIRERLLKSYLKLEKKYKDFDDDKIYSLLLNSIALAMDPHSAHLLPADHDSFVIHISNKLEGIGAQLQEKDGYIVVKSLVQGGVAQKDGRLKAKDRIIAIDPGNGTGLKDLSDLDVEQTVNLVRGNKGTSVRLVVLRKTLKGNERLNIILVRDEIDLKDDEVKTKVVENGNKKIGVIKISTFYTDLKCKVKIFSQCHGVSYDVEQGLKKLLAKGVDGILIDLRNNGGGDFPESIRMTGLFVPSGTAVQTLDRNQVIKKQQISESSWLYKGPLIVLINKYSASASEIFAGAIQDFSRGIVIGNKSTYGKASVQVVQEFPGSHGRRSDGALKVTQSKFYRPSGKSNQLVGVQSDIIIPDILDAFEIGEEQLDFALPLDSIPPAKNFRPLLNLSGLIGKLKLLSQERIIKNIKYREIIAKIERYNIEKKQPMLLSKEYVKSLEEKENPRDMKEKEGDSGDEIVFQNDLLMQEALNITSDSIKLTENNSLWIGMGN